MRPVPAVVLSIILVSAPAWAQAVVEVGEDLPLEVGVDLPLVEPCLAINPRSADNLIASALVIHPGGDPEALLVSSHDGGRTWQRRDLGIRTGGDGWVELLPDGTALFAVAAADPAVHVFRSTDGGRTWSRAWIAKGALDHPMLAVDGESEKLAGSVYLVSSSSTQGTSGRPRNAVYAARSADGGASFLEPGYSVASNLGYEANDAAVLSDGTLLVTFADHHRPGERRRLERQRDWLIASADGGKTFSEPMLVSESCDGRGGWSSLAVNHSFGLSPPDRIFHACAAPGFDGILLRYSDSLGEIWSPPLRVDRPGNVVPYTRTQAVAVNRDGAVAVAWYDGRGDGSTVRGSLRCTEIFVAISLDGGKTFLPEAKVSSAKSCPAEPRNLQAALRFPAGGEHMGLAAAPDGTFRLLWSDSRSGIYQLRTATVKVARP